MKVVQPIREPEVVEGIKHFFLVRSKRNYLLFCLGIYSGLRVTDLLSLQVRHVRGKSHIIIKEGKTKKTKKFLIHPDVKIILEEYIATMQDEDYLFPSRQRKKKSGIRGRPIHRTTAYKILNVAAKQFGLHEFGCHTLRKTWGYHLYMKDPSQLALLMEMFNHSDQGITLRYLGLTQEAMDLAILRMSYSQKGELCTHFQKTEKTQS